MGAIFKLRIRALIHFQQIIILDWFLKDHVMLKTGGMIMNIQIWSQE